MNLLGALFLQVMMIRWIVGLAIPLIVGFAFRGDTNGTFSSVSRSRFDPGIARASDEWRAAPQRVKTVSTSSEEAIEAAITECMEAWDATPLEPRDQFNRPVDTGPAARDAMRPLAEARCRRSARYKSR
jgi:hypothetical protein